MDTFEFVLNKKIKGVASGFKTAYSNGDGTYTVEFIDGTKVTTNFIKGDKGDIGVGVADVVDNGDGTFKLKLDDGTFTSNIATVQGIQGVQGERGVNGVGITEITKQSTTGLKDTYIITFSDGSQTTYEVTNGANITKTSQLVNDNNFIDRLVTNLVNYYSKAEVYTKEQIDELMRNVGAGLGIAIVDVLPSSDISTTTIYLVANGDNNYIQYMYIADNWANLGSTTVDLTNYYTKEQIDNLFLGYVTSDVFQIALADYAKIEALGKVAFSNSYNDLDDLPEIPSTEGFMKGRQVLGEVDLNDCITEGTFTVTASSANLPNVPIYGTYADLEVLSIETVVSQQLRIVVGDSKTPMLWSRCRIIDTWTEWVHALSNEIATEEVVDNSRLIPTSKAVYDKLSNKLNGTAIPVALMDTLVGTSGTPSEFAEKLKEYTGLNTAIYYRFSTSSNRDVLYNYGLIPTSSNYYIELHITGTTTNFYITATKQIEDKNYIRRIYNGVAQDWKELATMDNLGEKADKENAVVKNFRITNNEGTATVIPWNDGTHFRNVEGNINSDYTELSVGDGKAMLYQLRNGVSVKAQELATMDNLNVQEEDIATTAGFTIHASKSGNVVHLTFSGTTNVAFTSSEAKVIATLPEKYRPHRQVYDRIGVSASGNMYITVYSDGRVSMGYLNFNSGSNLNGGYMYML